MNILLLHRPKSASDYHRIYNPFRYLPLESGEHIEYKTDDEQYTTGEFKNTDLVIFNRHPTVDLDILLEMKKRYGFKMWVDIDDIWELYEHHYLYETWTKNKIADLILKSITNADIVTVTNQRLFRRVSDINKKCIVIPNALPIGHEQFKSEKTEASRLRFMYSGGPSHQYDLESIKDFFTMVNMNVNFKIKTKFILAGFNSNYKEKALHEMNDVMKISPSYSTRDALSLNRYMEHYNYTDVALAPLEHNQFNYFKSNLKIIEAGCMKTPVMASRLFPYLEDEEMENSGIYFCDKPSDWFAKARTLMENMNLVLDDGERLHEYVKRKYDLLKVNLLRRQLINSFK